MNTFRFWSRPASGLVLALGLAWAGVQAQAAAAGATVWRCGADGRSYSATPCAQGTPVQVGDGVDAARRAEAADVVARERAALKSLAAERRAREAEGRAQGAAGFRPLPREGHAIGTGPSGDAKPKKRHKGQKRKTPAEPWRAGAAPG